MKTCLDIMTDFIDRRVNIYVNRLKELVAIPSISEDTSHRLDVLKALRWCGIRLKNMGFEVCYRKVGKELIYEGDQVPMKLNGVANMPPIVCASLGHDQNKATLLIYGHVDVKPVSPQESWKADPFDLTIIEGFMYGRGVADDKGPVVGWINAIEAFIQCKEDLPVNIRFLIEGSEETGSEGLRELLHEMRRDFLKDVDYVAISDNYWLNMNTPCLTYGLRGVVYFHVFVDGSNRDLHSGSHGGAVQEPLADLQALMNSLVDFKGDVMVPRILDAVREPEEGEIKRFETLDFNTTKYGTQIETKALHTQEKVETLVRRWLLPSISFHGIEKSFDNVGSPTLIPKSVMGKFSIRLVPDQDPNIVIRQVVEYLHKVHLRRCSRNKVTIKVFRDGRPFLGDLSCPNYKTACLALTYVWDRAPDLIRDGASISMATILREQTGKDVVLIPMAECQSFAHEGDERMSVRNYINGIKVFATYMAKLRSLKSNCVMPKSYRSCQ